MICHQWFPTPIWCGNLDNINNAQYNAAIQYCLDLKKNNVGRSMSNLGGWQSNSFLYNDIKETPLSIFFNVIDSYANQAFLELGITSAHMIDSIWININKKNDYNELHYHPISSISGVFYLTQENSEIIFSRDLGVPRHHLAWMRSNTNTPLSYNTVTYTPKRGSFFLFPSWLEHCVEPSRTDEERISVAFNYSYP